MQELIGKFHSALQQFVSEVAEGDIPAGYDEHNTERQKIDQVNDHHREERALRDMPAARGSARARRAHPGVPRGEAFRRLRRSADH